MRTKKKVSLTIDTEIMDALEAIALSSNLAKSQIAQEALSLWLKKRTEDLIALGYAEMEEEDRSFSKMTFTAQTETF
ncbi:hypothetical protein MTBBW1_330004 [Desulfamplus magnetovallimortis]|uniref:Ribbon-helix-helix protein CopG domain-containing protein n=1 Tax=Desulfamplus magnetovallimortis TaxID=1246637 RepID=A0A1W1HG25_9BACT|nr:hypothetical protein [Desulfamplus magnetovallimortis]SLM31437.1 hypothetical protein MTBBW1_330004 [Desulfamplus magnetovallimortis]